MNTRNIIISIASLAVFFGCRSAVVDPNPVLDIAGGKVQGVATQTEGVIAYKGIPFAAPPVGDLRWKAPQPVITWEGVKVCDSFGNACPQPPHGEFGLYEKEFFSDGDAPFSEDCLYLNVWTPASGKTEANLPVCVWTHGGGYVAGWGFEKEMDGEAWAKRGVILVTLNYRLGIYGCLAHPELSAEDPHNSSGNYGFLDQLAAILWVKDNIRQFGGNPEDITVMGQSAGAGSVMNQVSSPLSKGLIKKAIIQSGGGGTIDGTTDVAERKAAKENACKEMMDSYGFTSLEKMRAASTQEIWEAYDEFSRENRGKIEWRPCPEGWSLFETFFEAVENRHVADIPYMIGSVQDDMEGAPKAAMKLAEMRLAYSDKPVYTYQFARPLPGDDEGAFHSSELWYMFGTLDRCWRPFIQGDYDLSEYMLDCWTNFAKYGNPNGPDGGKWLPYGETNHLSMIFKLDENEKEASEMGEFLPKMKHF